MATRRREDNPAQRGETPAGGARKARKKPKATPSPRPTPSSTPKPRSGPIPTPYLALAPTPISSLSPSAIDQLASTSSLILPSSYVRSNSNRGQTRDAQGQGPERTTGSGVGVGGDAGPSRLRGAGELEIAADNGRTGGDGGGASGARGTASGNGNGRAKYVTNLLSPPAIIPGGTSSTPRIQPQPPANPRRRSGERDRDRDRDRTGPRTRRSEERLRDLVNVNASLTSLGQLGRILESDPTAMAEERQREQEQEDALAQARETVQQAGRRRRRIVRGENGGVVRRLTVSSREEGRAIGLARGASMRRTNVWDDIPEAGEPPPPFPFPTSSTNRLPPAFATSRPTDPHPENTNEGDISSTSTGERPRSPPPSFEIAIGLIPLARPASAPAPAPAPTTAPTTRTATPPTPRPVRPVLSLSTSEQIPSQILIPPSPTISPASTRYASAPSSPAQTVIASADNLPIISSLSLLEPTTSHDRHAKDARDDRREWNEDLLAGYTLEERVQREMERRRLREDRENIRRTSADGPALSQAILPAASAVTAESTTGQVEGSDTSIPVSAPATALSTESNASQSGHNAAGGSAAITSPAEVQATSSLSVDASTSPIEPTISISPVRDESAPSTEDTASPSLPVPVEQEFLSPDHRRDSENADVEVMPVTTEERGDQIDATVPSTSEVLLLTGPRAEKALPALPILPTATTDSSIQQSSRPVTPEAVVKGSSPETPKAILPVEPIEPPPPDRTEASTPIDQKATIANPAAKPVSSRSNAAVADEQVKPSVRLRSQPSRSSSLDPSTSPKASAIDTKRLSVPNIDATTKSNTLKTGNVPSRPTGPLFRGYSWSNSPELGSSPNLEPPLALDESKSSSGPKAITPISIKTETQEHLLPPNREAALRRRNLQSASPMPPSPLPSVKPPSAPSKKPMAVPKRSTPVSGPLINFDTPTPSPPSTPKRSHSLSGTQPQERSPYQDISALAASSAELLALLEDGFVMDHDDRSDGNKGWNWTEDNSSRAESSAMGAKRMEAIALASPPLLSPPPLPPPTRKLETPTLTLRRVPPPFDKSNDAISKDKISPTTAGQKGERAPEAEVANDRSLGEDTPGDQPKANRRPPPPPPSRPRPVLSLRQPPPLPPRPGDAPDIVKRVTPKRTTSASTASNSTIVPFPSKRAIEPIRRVSGGLPSVTSPPVALTTRPKGPRPPPPPPPKRLTSWFKSSTPVKDAQPAVASSPTSPAKRTSPITTAIISEPTLMLRPPNERAQSEIPRMVPSLDQGKSEDDTSMEVDRDGLQGSERGVNRSASAVNLREPNPLFPSSSPSASKVEVLEDDSSYSNDRTQGENLGEGQRQMTAEQGQEGQSPRREWTDLDLLAARIEGSGREFEGFTQITSFLGPSKTPGATPAALATLLPGLINVDSRRTTPQGRVKLKLSLLGLRVSKCPICLSQFKGGEKAVMLPMCSHVGHESCARRWFRESARCWVCREVLPEEGD
ncbi:hypothetical protein IAT40_002732 [Kwoniella sp. CBS 6097]